MRDDFESVQARICEFKALLDGRLSRSQRGVMAMYGTGDGGGRDGDHSGHGRDNAVDNAGRDRGNSGGRGGGRGGDRGCGGGAGHGSGGRGNSVRRNNQNGHVCGRSNFRWDQVNSKGCAALEKCKLNDGSWNVESIMDGRYDVEAMRQTHIAKMYYPEEVAWKALELFERRKVFLNCMNTTGGGGKSG